MGLIDLKTDLKSLRYGQDRPGGGDSGQPYIKTNINTVSNGKLIKIDDGLVRGGFLGSQAKSATDTLRISKFLIDAPRGPLFIVKQIGLQLSGPRLESKELKVDKATKGGGFFKNATNLISNVVNKIENAVGPTRIYNLGINTLAQVQVNALGGHIVRHGFLPIEDPSKYYESVVKNNAGLIDDNVNHAISSNRLLKLSTRFSLGRFGAEENLKINTIISKNRSIFQVAGMFLLNTNPLIPLTSSDKQSLAAKYATSKFPAFNGDDGILNQYIGGPGSVYGIGSTVIKRATGGETGQTISKANAKKRSNAGTISGTKITDTFDWGISTITGSKYKANGRLTFDLLQDPKNQLNGSFIDNVSSDSDRRVDYIHKTNAIYNANAELRYNTKFYFGVSNYASSSLTNTTFDTNRSSSISDKSNNSPITLNDRTAISDLSGDKSGLYKIPTTVNYYGTLGLSNQYFSSSEAADVGVNPQTKRKTVDNAFTNTLKEINKLTTSITIPNNLTTATVSAGIFNPQYRTYRKIIDNRQFRENIDDGINEFGIYGENATNAKTLSFYKNGILPTSTNYPKYKNAYGDIVTQKIQWNEASREIRIGSGRTDSVNLTPILDGVESYDGQDVRGGHDYRDLVKFKIQAINTDTPDTTSLMVFRAYLTGLSDSVDASWQDIKYAGRGDKFYIYDGFTRKMSVSFKVAALSVKEMQPMYRKLNFLMGNLMPDYKDNLMRGPLVRMTIGNYIDAQLCKLDSVSYTIPNDSPWEIAMDEPEGGARTLILPHIIEVQLSFTPIGSESNGSNKIQSKSQTTSHIAQNNTGTLYQYIQ